ncbi:MAG TPA: SH3 domain-containing protein [Anaerolineae bacterium]|nr:SH3 domain-containing protein [Anaerolineae bacterium]
MSGSTTPVSEDVAPRSTIRRITHVRQVWSLEWTLLSSILAGGAIGACLLIAFVAWVGSGAPGRAQTARPAAIVITVTPSPIVPTSTPTPVPSPSSTPSILMIGGHAQVSGTQGDALRLRSDPGLQTTTLKTIPEGARLLILDGPRDADNIAWWRLRDPSDGAEGWAAQSYLVPSGAP